MFPEALQGGYRLKDGRTSARTAARLRRIRLKATGEAFCARPAFLLPYAVGTTDDARGPLFLRAFGAPCWAPARVFGKGPMSWDRSQVSPGRSSLAGTTVRRAGVPEHLLADEHRQTRDGDKNALATTAGAGCRPGAALAPTASADDVTAAYAVFPREAQDVRDDYRPRTASVDGGASRHQARQALFPLAVLPRCFLHGGLASRSRGKLGASFREPSRKAWEACLSPDRRCFAQRLRRRAAWARGQPLSARLLEQVEGRCGRSREYGLADAHPGGQRTSAMLDRVMRSMSRSVEDGPHLRGCPEAGGLPVRAWALLQNLRPRGPEAVRANGGWRSPAERRNRHRHRYHDDGLQNLRVSASLGGYRR